MTQLIYHKSLEKQWTKFKQRWDNCGRCPLASNRRKVVHVRGYLPCDIAFVGEAPGESEDSEGYPFVGPAGSMFDDILLDAARQLDPEAMLQMGRLIIRGVKVRFAVMNVVGCWPQTESALSSGKIRPPTADEAHACEPHLLQLMDMVKPRIVITLGNVAKQRLPHVISDRYSIVNMMHPAAILRDNRRSMQLDFNRCSLAVKRQLQILLRRGQRSLGRSGLMKPNDGRRRRHNHPRPISREP